MRGLSRLFRSRGARWAQPRACALPALAHLAEPAGATSLGARRLADDGCSFEEVFAVRCYEVGPDQLATMVTVANLLQEVAANHAQELWGAGAWAPALMTEQHLAFALSKLHIRLDAPLQWCAPRRAAHRMPSALG